MSASIVWLEDVDGDGCPLENRPGTDTMRGRGGLQSPRFLPTRADNSQRKSLKSPQVSLAARRPRPHENQPSPRRNWIGKGKPSFVVAEGNHRCPPTDRCQKISDPVGPAHG